MRNQVPTLSLAIAAAFAMSSPGHSADDWSFIAGKYALEPDDCKLVAKGQPFSKGLFNEISSEVMTREGITSPREVHCKFRSSKRDTGSDAKWTVKADCEEMGDPSPYELEVTTNSDGSIVVTSEDVYGPPLTFVKCPQ